MKKIIALLLCLLTLAIALAACGERSTEAPKTETPKTETSKTETPTTETPVPPTPTETPTTETPVVTETPVPLTPEEVLAGKTALFCGDSLCMASTYDTEHQWWGWAGRVNKNYKLKSYKNVGVDGASVSNVRGTNTIIAQVNNNKNGKFDFVILEGSTNDGWDAVSVGKMVDKPASECVPGDFDLSTFAGGLENLFYYAEKYFTDSCIGYMFNYQLNSGTGRMKDMTEYLEEAKKICEKWDMPLLNLYEMEEFSLKNFANKHARAAEKPVASDGIHANSVGYDKLTPVVAQFMADIWNAKYPGGGSEA